MKYVKTLSPTVVFSKNSSIGGWVQELLAQVYKLMPERINNVLPLNCLWQPLINFAIWWKLKYPHGTDLEVLVLWWTDYKMGKPKLLDAFQNQLKLAPDCAYPFHMS